MKLGKNNIQGIYKFDTSAAYEVGDFVINNSSIYVCKVSKSNIASELMDNYTTDNPAYFSPYPNNIITVEEFKKLKEGDDSNLRDKYVSSEVLAQLLQNHFYYGLTDNGVLKKIKDCSFDILENAEDSRPDSVKTLEAIGKNYNTALFQLDKEFISELFKNIGMSLEEDDSDYYTLIDSNYNEEDSVFLFQIAFNDNKVAQQIINASTGFQTIRISDENRNFKTWYSISPNANLVFNQIKTIQSALNDRANNLRNLAESLKNRFAFKSTIPNTESEIDTEEVGFKSGEDFFVDVILIKKTDNNIYLSKTVTVNLNDVSESAINYEDSIELVLNTGTGDIKITGLNDWVVKNIYYRVKSK